MNEAFIEGHPYYILLHISVLTAFIMLLTAFYLLYIRKKKYIKNLKDFQKKLEFITMANDIVIMQYDVRNRIFNRWDPNVSDSYYTFNVKEFWNHIHPDDLPTAHQMIDSMDSMTDNPFTCEYRSRMPKSTQYFWIYNDVFPFEHNKEGRVSSYIGICRRNSKWHEVEDKLERFRQNVSFITSANGIMFIRYDVADDALRHLDNRGELTESIIPINEYCDSVHPDDLPAAHELLSNMREHTKERFLAEYRYKMPGSDNYDWYAINIVACKYDKYHHISSYLCLCRNNNEWREAMDEMIKLRDKAESANKMKNSFLANMSHEIRTPLNAVVGFSSMMSESMSEEERNKFKQIIAHNNKMLLQIVDDVLALSKIESGDIEFVNTNFDINDFIQSIADSMHLTINPNIKLICESQERFNVCWDSRRLTEMITTLLVNANNFTQKGFIKINYGAKDGGLYVSISDTGIGIAKKDQKRIFERFEKVNSFISGTGLGLPICKGIVEQAHGKIGVESELNEGATFWFWIPCKTSKK